MSLWQIASGDHGRDYSRVFLEHDVMLIGPGRHGVWQPDAYADEHMGAQIRSFVEDPQPGDIVLLRNGPRVVAVGRIPEGSACQYSWFEGFDDVLGWDLQHVRRVAWTPEIPHALSSLGPPFAKTRQRTFSEVHQRKLTALLPGLAKATPSRALRELPCSPLELPLDDVAADIFAAGVANESADRAISSIRRARRLQRWYWSGEAGDRPTEVEAVTHMIVPLMVALGWSEQLLAVEWKKVDLAFFQGTPTGVANCVMVCEAKSPGKGLGHAYSQARRYVERLGLVQCDRILVSDGTLYLVYDSQAERWPETPSAYVNLSKITEECVLPGTAGGLEALRRLIPNLQ